MFCCTLVFSGPLFFTSTDEDDWIYAQYILGLFHSLLSFMVFNTLVVDSTLQNLRIVVPFWITLV